MARYECSVCGYVYDESKEDTPWADLPHDWTCPVCAAAKAQFELVSGAPTQRTVMEAAPMAAPAAAPTANRAILAHRVFGYIFLAIYVVLMVQMVPRLWTYQIEFPARTVVHLSLGMAIGVILLLKIAIVRFFRRLDQAMVPLLGTCLLIGSTVLIGISVPSAFREALAVNRMMNETNRSRVRTLLAQTGLDASECARLTTVDALRRGQRILRQQCIYCHDLRTVLAKPRTPENWRQTVARMADRTTMLNPIDENEQLLVTAYLVALSPELQRSARQLRLEQDRHDRSRQAAATVTTDKSASTTYDRAAAKRLFEKKCSQCHPINIVDTAPPGNEAEARKLVSRMVNEGLVATEEQLTQIAWYLTETHAKAAE